MRVPECIAETQQAADLSKSVLPSKSSAALFAAWLRIARWYNPGRTSVPTPSPASTGGDKMGVNPKWNTKDLPARLEVVPLPTAVSTAFFRSLFEPDG